MRYALALVRQNVPFDVAFSLDWPELMAWNVVLGEIESGKTFDWNRMRFPD